MAEGSSFNYEVHVHVLKHEVNRSEYFYIIVFFPDNTELANWKPACLEA